MDLDDDTVADFVTRYVAACAEVGVDPLPIEDLTALAEAMLTGNVSASQTLH